MLSGAARVMTLYGGTITAISAPVHDNAAGSGDDLADITVTFSVPSTASATEVQLLYGGHLASSLGTHGWGSGLGSSSISGGSYHSRAIAADGASLGNRDNQIQGSTIGTPSISTTQVPSSGSVGVVIHDTATLTVLANFGLSTQLFVLGACLAFGHPAAYLWIALGCGVSLVPLERRRVLLARA